MFDKTLEGIKNITIIITCIAIISTLKLTTNTLSKFNNYELCFIAMSPEEYLKTNKKLIEYRAQELSNKKYKGDK